MVELFKLMYTDEYGTPSLHASELKESEAREMLREYEETFPDVDYYVEPMFEWDKTTHPIAREYARGTADGWEDLFDY